MSSLAIKRTPPSNPVIGNVATAQVFSQLSNPLLPTALAVPGKLAIEAKKFTVRAEGNAYVNGAYTLKATLLAALVIPAVPFTSTNWTVLGSGTARAIATTTYAPWFIQADCQFDSQSGIMHGVFSQLVNDLYDGAAVLAATVTGINGTNVIQNQGAAGVTPVAPTDPALYFAVALTFGTAGLNIGNLANFELGF
ncbi:MAG TPA: hypothetical protein VFE27_24415 [Acidobacteriaceae bacterium]|jgi:hypothetical protein|nr:hypothetical protein [Acidobacteriaceae bacterium]